MPAPAAQPQPVQLPAQAPAQDIFYWVPFVPTTQNVSAKDFYIQVRTHNISSNIAQQQLQTAGFRA